jgi:hypothetical protein
MPSSSSSSLIWPSRYRRRVQGKRNATSSTEIVGLTTKRDVTRTPGERFIANRSRYVDAENQKLSAIDRGGAGGTPSDLNPVGSCSWVPHPLNSAKRKGAVLDSLLVDPNFNFCSISVFVFDSPRLFEYSENFSPSYFPNLFSQVA